MPVSQFSGPVVQPGLRLLVDSGLLGCSGFSASRSILGLGIGAMWGFYLLSQHSIQVGSAVELPIS